MLMNADHLKIGPQKVLCFEHESFSMKLSLYYFIGSLLQELVGKSYLMTSTEMYRITESTDWLKIVPLPTIFSLDLGEY